MWGRFSVLRIVMFLVLVWALFLTVKECGNSKAQYAKPKRKTVIVFMTFHSTKAGRITSEGKKENAKIAAQNRTKKQKNALPIGTTIIPVSYKDKKTGQWVNSSLSKRFIADTMGPSARKKDYLWIDYYYEGELTPEMQKFNATWVKIEIVY